ncbi:hypothetical protein ACFP7A_04065 [Sporolactobacillus kofuensis]|uniref:Integral membrane protein n=1 Tax=Sporolactobacillus kofuensis TaxID=269672 RepID=A0ABW1WC06_9BACL|nr:hypothetical protein [Sporolactobacillus kofuensis]MCO7174982.1 hypothetical protein [Sporolactobacillus kofuensis]
MTVIVTILAFGWTGIFLFFLLSIKVNGLAKKNEYALIHVLFILIFSSWLPIPLIFSILFAGWPAQIGALYGILSLSLFIIAMALQTGHIIYSNRHAHEQKKLWDNYDSWMMSMLSDPIEVIAGIFAWISAIFNAIALVHHNIGFTSIIIFLLSLQIIYCVALLLRSVLNSPPQWINSIKPNPYILNIGLFLYFLVILIRLTIDYYL